MLKPQLWEQGATTLTSLREGTDGPLELSGQSGQPRQDLDSVREPVKMGSNGGRYMQPQLCAPPYM